MRKRLPQTFAYYTPQPTENCKKNYERLVNDPRNLCL